MSIQRLTREEQLAEYTEVFQVFGLPLLVSEHNNALFKDLALKRHWPWYRFLGKYQNKPVTITDLFFVGNMACVFSVATVEKFQRRGFATFTLLYPSPPVKVLTMLSWRQLKRTQNCI